MKHINRFKLFEDKSEINKLISDVKDMCLELNDIGLNTECHLRSVLTKPRVSREYISLSIERELYDDTDFGDYLANRRLILQDLPWIDWVVVKDVVITILEYMKDNGWKPSYIILDGDYHRVEDLDVGEDFLHIFEPNRKFWGLQFDFIRF